MICFEVAVAAPIDQSLTYKLPDISIETEADYIGRRVLVPLGRRRVTGYVIGITEPSTETKFKIRNIISFLDSYPLFHSNIISLYRWISDYYQYPLGMVIKTALPGGLAPKSRKRIHLIGSGTALADYFQENIPDWGKIIQDKKVLDNKRTQECLRSASGRKIIHDLEELGVVKCLDEVQKDAVREKKELCFGIKSNVIEEAPVDFTLEAEVIKKYRLKWGDFLGTTLTIPETKTLCAIFSLQHQSNLQTVALKDLRKLYSGISKPLQSLKDKGIVTRTEERVYRSPFGSQFRYYPRPENLTDEQNSVLGQILPEIKEKNFQPVLLHGITGCGKTEIYLQAAEEALACGRDVIVLVPEIALATQLEAQMLSRFGDNVALLHSGMSSAEKYDQYYLALTGKVKIVIGARSAIFAPLKNPGLIIVDEEHDGSYKQDDGLRYNGRDVAVMRAKHQACSVVLGSATPSVSSFSNARNGKYKLLMMSRRVGESVLPSVSLVDLNNRDKTGHKSIIRKELLAALGENLQDGKQSVLLLNRRGFSAALICQDCGTPVQCDHCNVSLTLHKGIGKLICHYCGFTQTKDLICVECRSTSLVPAGFGTERVEEELLELLPEAQIRRLDSDTAADRKKFLKVISEMHDKTIDILIGTQMIAKGHHFPNVTLVGVVWADGGMSMPDYKAAERTFQLITQVTGRAGRGEHPGRVIIQTLRPDHYAIQYAKNHQFVEFYEHELHLRQSPIFPPFVRLILLRIKGRVDKNVQRSCRSVARFCRETGKNVNVTLEVLGPAPSPIDKVKDQFRWQVLLKGSDVMILRSLCQRLDARKKELLESGCTLSVDVDPENMM